MRPHSGPNDSVYGVKRTGIIIEHKLRFAAELISIGLGAIIVQTENNVSRPLVI